MILITENGEQLDVTLVNPTTKKAQEIVHKYEYTKKGDTIYKAYGRPSSAKVEAFNQIVKEMQEVGGSGMRITGAGSDIFSCAYKVKREGQPYLIYHTPSNRFAVPLF